MDAKNLRMRHYTIFKRKKRKKNWVNFSNPRTINHLLKEFYALGSRMLQRNQRQQAAKGWKVLHFFFSRLEIKFQLCHFEGDIHCGDAVCVATATGTTAGQMHRQRIKPLRSFWKGRETKTAKVKFTQRWQLEVTPCHFKKRKHTKLLSTFFQSVHWEKWPRERTSSGLMSVHTLFLQVLSPLIRTMMLHINVYAEIMSPETFSAICVVVFPVVICFTLAATQTHCQMKEYFRSRKLGLVLWMRTL